MNCRLNCSRLSLELFLGLKIRPEMKKTLTQNWETGKIIFSLSFTAGNFGFQRVFRVLYENLNYSLSVSDEFSSKSYSYTIANYARVIVRITSIYIRINRRSVRVCV